MRGLNLIVKSSLGGYERLRCLRRLRCCCACQLLAAFVCLLLVLLGKGHNRSLELSLLQTCMYRISFCFYLFRHKTFGAVIKFCIISQKLFAKNKLQFGDCLQCTNASFLIVIKLKTIVILFLATVFYAIKTASSINSEKGKL